HVRSQAAESSAKRRTVSEITVTDSWAMPHNLSRMTPKLLKWILIGVMTAELAPRGLAATREQCTELLQRALEDKNPDTRKQAVVALSLAAANGPLFTRLAQMLQDKDVEVR